VAETVRFFMLPEDERAFLRALAPHGLTLFPEVFPPGTVGRPVDESVLDGLDLEACYLAVERLGPVVVHPLRRGKDRGMLEIEEIPSPVLHFERSRLDGEGELVGGKLWAELDVTDDPGSRLGKPRALRLVFEVVQRFFRKSWRRSEPKGWWIGPGAAGAVREGRLRLREPGHKGREIRVWR